MWKTIQNTSYYEINELGEVRNTNTGKLRKHSYNEDGYPFIRLTVAPYKQRKFFVHRLIAENFIKNPKPDEYNIVLHLDDNVKNFNIDNLKWGTQKMNMEQSSETGFYSTVKKEATLISPEGVKVHIIGLRTFCRENNLDWGNFQKVVKGKHKSIKGWKLFK